MMRKKTSSNLQTSPWTSKNRLHGLDYVQSKQLC